MNLLINLVLRIMSGEGPEKGSARNSAYWLGFLASFPVVIVLFAIFYNWVEHKTRFSLMDSYMGIFAVVLMICLAMFALLTICVRLFPKKPFWLIPVAVFTWSGTAFLLLRHDTGRTTSGSLATDPTPPPSFENPSKP